MPSLENTLGNEYSGRPAGARALPLAVYQVGAGKMDGDAAAPEAVDRLPAQSVSAVGPSLSSARDRACMPSIHSGGCDRRARRRWLRQCLRDPLGIPTDAILARKARQWRHWPAERRLHPGAEALMSLSRKPVMASISERENREIKAANPGHGPLLIIDGAKDHTVPWAIANAAKARVAREAAQ
jgi:hypothetical protein